MSHETPDVAPAFDASNIPSTEKPPQPLPPQFFKIHVDNKDLTSANVRFTWCLTKAATDLLRDKNVAHPFLLVTVVTERADGRIGYDEVDRIIYPLEQGMGLVQFNRPGTFTISAIIIWVGKTEPSSSRKSSLRSLNCLLGGNQYESGFVYHHRTVLNADKSIDWERLDGMGNGTLPRAEQFDVTIDESLFAKQPAPWVWTWCNLWFDRRPRNACTFRKRWIFAFTLKPFIALAYVTWLTIVRTIFTIAFLLWGRRLRAITFSAIRHPFAMQLKDLDADDTPQGNWVETNRHGEGRSWLLQQILPPWRITLFVLISWFLLMRFPLLFSIGLLMCAIALVGGFIYHLILTHSPKVDQDEARRRTARYYETKLDPLVCDADEDPDVKPTLASLPASHRTLYVRFLAAKNELCLPFRT